MYVAYLAGGIASGKSSAAHQLEELGAVRIDLDQLSREVLAPGSATCQAVADAFGADLIQADQTLDRSLLASRAFVSAEATRRLEAIELPEIGRLLECRLHELAASSCAPCCVIVEVPLLDRVLQAAELANQTDEILVVSCPLSLRRQRAIGRGMDPQDFDRRVVRQPDEAWLRAHGDTVFDNAGAPEALEQQIGRWWQTHAEGGWKKRGYQVASYV